MNGLVTLRRDDLFQFLGKYALPPWPDGKGGWLGHEVDCAPIAAELETWVALHEVRRQEVGR